jgi:antitoxin component of MazEF toxin-antitoxin module
MTTVKIDISDRQAAALTARAAAQGLTLERLVQKVVEREVPPENPRYTLAELLAQCDLDAPLTDEDRAWVGDLSVGREAL